MTSFAVFNNNTPGIFVNEQPLGATPSIGAFSRIYYVGTASALATGREPLEAYQITSLEDFLAQFGGSSALTLNTLEWAFKFYSDAQIFYTAVQAAEQKTITITEAAITEGQTYELSFTVGTDIHIASYITQAADTSQQIIQGLLNGVNNNVDLNTLVEVEPDTNEAGVPVYTTNLFYIRAKSPALMLPALTVSLNLSQTVRTGGVDVRDWEGAVSAFPAEDLEPGYLVAPEAFYSLTKLADRTALQQEMERVVSQGTINWVSIVDFGPPDLVPSLAEAHTERDTYTSPKGHSWMVGPWPTDADNDHVSPAMCQAMLALRLTNQFGQGRPPAGTTFPLIGLKPTRRLTDSERETANEAGINLLHYINNRGLCVFGARTLSDKLVYRFANRRVILNSYVRDVRNTLVQGDIIFSPVEGEGVLFNKVRAAIDGVAFRYWQGQLFYGADPDEAFLNICDRTNNPDLDLDSGAVQATSAVKLSSTAERIIVTINPVAIAESFT